jgi:hypothetical protein
MKILLPLTVLLLVLIGGLWVFLEGPLRDPDAAMRDFLKGEDRFEDQLTDPLVLAGPRVRPLITAAVVDREMKHRRYALAYLGCAGYAPAQEAIRRILTDDTERDYFRADALEALWRLDRNEGEALAQTYRTREDALGQMAVKLIETGSPWAECRSWIAALMRRHE